MSTIVTCTPNPSLDRTVEVERLRPGAVHRATGAHLDAGGKGVNVARVLALHGVPVRAVLPLGGPEGAHFAALLDELGLAHHAVAVAGATRTNVTVVEHDGTTTKLNVSGAPLLAAEADELLEATVQAVVDAPDGAWVVGSGSLPPGVPEDFYAALVRQVHRRSRARVAIDTSGAALRACLDAGPDLIKPNEHELAEISGQRADTLAEVVAAAQALVDKGVGTVLVSLGALGAVAVQPDAEPVHVEPPEVHVRSTVGAGDATLAGWLWALGNASDRPPTEVALRSAVALRAAVALRSAVAWGSAATALPGTTMPGPDDVHPEQMTVHHRIDLDRRLDG